MRLKSHQIVHGPLDVFTPELDHGKGGLSRLFGKGIEQRSTEDSRMIYARVHDVFANRLVDRERPANRRPHGPAVTRVGVNLGKIYALLFQGSENCPLAVFKLVCRLIELRKFFCRMRDI